MSLNINEIANEYTAHKDAAEGGNDFLSNFVKLPDGKGALDMRFLPPAKKGLHGDTVGPFYQWTRIHRVNGKNLHCPRKKIDGKWQGDCPVCQYIRWLWNESEKKAPDEAQKMQDEYRALKANERYYYNVIVRKTTDGEENSGPLIYSCGIQVHSKILAAIVGDEDVGQDKLDDISDIKKGYDFKLVKTIRKTGSKEWANYDTSHFPPKGTTTPLGDPEAVETWLNNLNDLAALRILKTPEELKHELKIHLGVAKEAASGFDPTEFQKPQTSAEATATSEPEEPEASAASEASTPAPAPAETPSFDVDAPAGDGDEVLADQEFLDQLRNMG